MARKKRNVRRAPKTVTKYRTRTVTKRAKRRVSNTIKPLNSVLLGGAYGFLRAKSSNFVRANISSRIPVGNYADEIAFTGLSYLLAKHGKKVAGVNLKDIGKAGLQAEGFLIGHNVGQNGLALTTSSGNGW